MLTITDHTSGKTRKYATSDSELVNSLFNDGSGTLNPIHKKETRGDALLFWTDEKAAFIFGNRLIYGGNLQS